MSKNAKEIDEIRKKSEKIQIKKGYLFGNLAKKSDYYLEPYLNNIEQNREAPVFLDTRETGEDIERTYDTLLRKLNILMREREELRQRLNDRKKNHPIGISNSIRNKNGLINSLIPPDVSRITSSFIGPTKASNKETARFLRIKATIRRNTARGRRNKNRKTHTRYHKRNGSRSRRHY